MKIFLGSLALVLAAVPQDPAAVASLLAKAAGKGADVEVMDKPERFQGTAFYPGAILLVGELVK